MGYNVGSQETQFCKYFYNFQVIGHVTTENIILIRITITVNTDMQLSDKPSPVKIISSFTPSVYASIKHNNRKSFNYLIIEKLKLSNSTLNLNCFVNLILIKNEKNIFIFGSILQIIVYLLAKCQKICIQPETFKCPN